MCVTASSGKQFHAERAIIYLRGRVGEGGGENFYEQEILIMVVHCE